MGTHTIQFEYTKKIVPFRCRKPRPQRFAGEFTFTISEVTAQEAPVAVTITKNCCHARMEYRFWDGRFFLPIGTQHRYVNVDRATGQRHCPRKFDPHKWHFNHVPYAYMTEDAARAQLANSYGKYLLVDGKVFIEVGEPRWCVMTFGLGHNHGGTSLMWDTYYNSNIHRDRYFRFDQVDEATKEAVAIATRRGDDQSIRRIRSEKRSVRVLMPEVLRVDPREHGEGDPFINRIEGLIDHTETAGEAGLFVLAAAACLS